MARNRRSTKRLRQKTALLRAARKSGRSVTNPMTRSQRKKVRGGKNRASRR